MHLRDLDSGTCSIARTLELVGAPWTLLVLRDMFNGMRRFDELADHLGIARNVLARRLAKLVTDGLVTRTEYREPGRRARHEYRLTPAGRDLLPVLIAVKDFGDRHLSGPEGLPVDVAHAACGSQVHIRLECESGHSLAPTDRLTASAGPGARLKSEHSQDD